MKYYKITLRYKPSTTELVYPENYQEDIGNKNYKHQSSLYYNEADGTPCLLMCIADKDAKDIVRDYVEDLTKTEAKELSEEYEARTEEITDEAKIRRLELKVAMEETLTADELKAIDPDDPTPGFGKTKILADKIDDYDEQGEQ